MRCNICDKPLSESEIVYIPETKSFDCCTTCLDIALEAAYCDGFQREEPLDDPDLDDLYGSGAVDILDVDTHVSTLDDVKWSLSDDKPY